MGNSQEDPETSIPSEALWIDGLNRAEGVASQAAFVTPGILLAAGLSYARAWREESSPHLKPINKIPKLIRIATAVIVAGGLAVMVLSAQDDLDTVRQAAEQGNATAQFSLGLMYADGEGVPKDDAEAVKWYRMSADQGYALAQFSLGFMYANGEGVPQDEAEVARWFRLAAEQGHAEALSEETGLSRRDAPCSVFG